MTGIAPTIVKISVIGLEYVGLPNAAGFAEIDVADIQTRNDLCEARKDNRYSRAQGRATDTSRHWSVS